MAKTEWRTIPGFTRIGKVGKAYGATGELRVSVDEGFEEQAIAAQFVFIRHSGSMVPYRVSHWRESRGLVIKLEGVESPSDTLQIVGRDLVMPQDRLDESALPHTSNLAYGHLAGFHIIDAHTGDLGAIDRVESFPQQEIAIVKVGDDESLIPMNEEFVVSIDEVMKIVHVNLPDGLVALYTPDTN